MKEKLTLKAIADFLNAEVDGDVNTVITGIAGIKEAQEGDITFLENQKYFSLLETTKASAIIVSKDFQSWPAGSKTVLRTENPSLAFSRIIPLLYPASQQHPRGIHPTAVIAKSARIAKDVAIGAHTIVGENVTIGPGSIIYGNCYIGDTVTIGTKALIYPMVTLREKTSLGERVIIHSGTVVGSDGFGYTSVQGTQEKIPQVGVVVIEDDVEIGSNVTIDRARFDKTLIGEGTKIDNLVQIAHNVKIGKHCIIIAQAGISGSTVIEDNVIIAGQAGLVGHITVGEGATIAAQAGVTKSVATGTTVSGYPARPHDQAKRVNACVQKLPQLYQVIDELKQRIDSLEAALALKEKKQ